MPSNQRVHWARESFARTNLQTIIQRADLLQERLPTVRSIGEICCGDARLQHRIYNERFPRASFIGLDIDRQMVAQNQTHGIQCVAGDSLDPTVMTQFINCDILFFGPPLSVNCDGHTLLSFREVVPSYGDFCHLLFNRLSYQGILVCIAPRTTTLGDIQHLHAQIRFYAPDVNLPLIYYSQSTVTGRGDHTPARLKYVEIWFSTHLPNLWEQRWSQTGVQDNDST